MKYVNNPFKKIRMLNQIVFLTIFRRRRILLIGTPLHGNLGDQAIAIAELKYLSDLAPDYAVVEIPSPIFSKMGHILKHFIRHNDLILVHGGGFLGDTWQAEENMFRSVTDNFPENNIIVLPQTAFFSNTKEGQEQLAKSQQTWQKHSHLTICCREEYSYNFVTKNFPYIKAILTPDIVLYLPPVDAEHTRTKALYCMRHDKEKIKINTTVLDQATSGLPRLTTDTVVPYTIYPWERSKELHKKLAEFQRSKVAGTDRLHGMVFAYLTKTPCVVYNNANYKIDGTYEWLKTCNYIIRGDASVETIESVMTLLPQNKKIVDLSAKFDPLTKLIKGSLPNG